METITTPEKMWKPFAFISGEVASSKNSRRNISKRNRKTGKRITISLPSEFASNYMKSAFVQFLGVRREWLSTIDTTNRPLHVGFYFYRKTEGRADYSNLVQAVQDCMVKALLIEDDNMSCLIPHFLGHQKDAENPGVMIYL